MYDYPTVTIKGYLHGLPIEKIVSTQEEGVIATKELRRMGCTDIQFPFDEMDNLPKTYDERDQRTLEHYKSLEEKEQAELASESIESIGESVLAIKYHLFRKACYFVHLNNRNGETEYDEGYSNALKALIDDFNWNKEYEGYSLVHQNEC